MKIALQLTPSVGHSTASALGCLLSPLTIRNGNWSVLDATLPEEIRSTELNAEREMREFIGGLIVLLGVIVWQALEYFGTLSPALKALEQSGRTGKLIASVAQSRLTIVILLLVAISLFFRGIKELREINRKQVLPLTPAPVPVPLSVNQTQNASPHIENRVYVGTGSPSATIEQNEKERPASITFVQARPVLLHVDQFGVWHEASTNLDRARSGIVAQFRNNPSKQGQQAAKAASVSARLVFKSPDLEEKLHINHGAWLGHYENVVGFSSGICEQLLVVLWLLPVVTLDNPNSSNPMKSRWRSGQKRIVHPQPSKLPGESGEVEITLVDSSGVTMFSGLFDYLFYPDKMTLELRPEA